MVIIVTGTPCTGKSTLARELALELKYEYVDVSLLVKDICSEFDDERDCLVVDVTRLNELLIAKMSKNKKLVIDSHLSHHIDPKYIDVCIVCKCELKELKKRLKARGYSSAKVRENMDAEIFDVCLVEAQEEMKHNVIVLETDNGYDIKEVVKRVNEAKHSRA